MMNNVRHSGLTWDHPRGYDALAQAAASSDGLIGWAKQPLEGFESHPIAELAAAYDLLVLDHPHIGEAVASDCLAPLESLFSTDQLRNWRAQTIGQAMASYFWRGQHWALPLDVATQVLAYRPDRIEVVPNSWFEVLQLSAREPVALSIAGPHALLNFFSICIAHGDEPSGANLVSDRIGVEALGLLQALYRSIPLNSEKLNPIGLLEAMATGDEIALVPLVFGYVNYAAPQFGRQRLVFADAPVGNLIARGSVLGGTGIAITKRARPDGDLLEHLYWLLSLETQARFIPRHGGQPSARAAWQDDSVNADWGGFYRSTLKSAESAWLRPRFDGYIAFQTAAASLIRIALADDVEPAMTLAKLRALWRDAGGEDARGRQ